jgi:outer membrane protein TolC
MRISFAHRFHRSQPWVHASLIMLLCEYAAGAPAPPANPAPPPPAAPGAAAPPGASPPAAPGPSAPSTSSPGTQASSQAIPPAPASIPAAPKGTLLPAGPLTLDQAIAIAFGNNGNVTVAEQTVEQERNLVTVARAGNLPNVTGGVSYAGTGFNDIGTTFGNHVREGTTWDEGPMPFVQLKATPLDSGQTRLSVREAKANVRAAVAGLDLERVNLAFDVTSAFIELLRAQQLVVLSQEQLDLANQQLQLSLGRIAAGVEAAVNRYQFDVGVANAQVTLLQNQDAVQQNGAALRAVMGLPVGPPPVLADVPLPPTSAALPAPPPVAQALATANTSHPQILQDIASVESNVYNLRLQELVRRPVFTTTATLAVTPNAPNNTSIWTLLAQVSMPIWDAGVTRARAHEARAGVIQAQAREAQSRVDISNLVQQAVLNIQNAKQRLDASRVAVDSASQNLEAENARYAQGLATPVDLTTARLSYFTAQTNQVQALYDYYIAQAQLKRAVGQ